MQQPLGRHRDGSQLCLHRQWAAAAGGSQAAERGRRRRVVAGRNSGGCTTDPGCVAPSMLSRLPLSSLEAASRRVQHVCSLRRTPAPPPSLCLSRFVCPPAASASAGRLAAAGACTGGGKKSNRPIGWAAGQRLLLLECGIVSSDWTNNAQGLSHMARSKVLLAPGRIAQSSFCAA